MMRWRWLQHQPLVGFCVLTFAWSWACWGLSAVVTLQWPWLAQVLMFAGGFWPSAAAVFVVWRTRGRAGLRVWFYRCMQWRVGWGWMMLALLAPLVVVAVAAGVHLMTGDTIAPLPASGQAPLAVINLFLAQAFVPVALIMWMALAPLRSTTGFCIQFATSSRGPDSSAGAGPIPRCQWRQRLKHQRAPRHARQQ